MFHMEANWTASMMSRAFLIIMKPPFFSISSDR